MEKLAQVVHLAKFGRLASGIVHDIINPLTAVSLNLEQIESSKIKGVKDTRKHIEQALAANKRMESFVSAVKRQIQQQEEKSLFSVNKEIDQAISILAYKSRKENVKIKFEASKEIEVFGNSIKMHQSITNLIADAIDAYKDQQKKNKLILIKLDKKNGTINLSIEDWGMGIAKKNISKIFDPFFTTKGVHEGTGIGLTTVKDVIEKDFNGTIRVKSQEGTGTTFFVAFPA